MPHEPPLPGDWAARMIPTLTEVVYPPGSADAAAVPAASEVLRPGPELDRLEPELRERIAEAVSAALREQWSGLSARVEAAVDRAVREVLAGAHDRRGS